MKPSSEERQADRRLPWLKREGFRRTAALIAAPAGVYAVLVLVSLLGGPRIGSPLIPLPGGGPDVTSPVAGQQPGQLPSRLLPPIPPDSPGATTTTPGNAMVTPLPSAPSTEELWTGGVDGQQGAFPTMTPTPTAELVERPGPSGPPATKTPPGQPPTTPGEPPSPTPTATSPTPSDPPTTPDDPDRPEPQTIGDVLRQLADLLTP